jgi:hypothetical protein
MKGNECVKEDNIMWDWLGSALELFGMWKVGNKKRYAFIFSGLGNFCWILYVYFNQVTYGLLGIVIPALIINIRNYLKWGKPKTSKELKEEITVLQAELEVTLRNTKQRR